jgi:hypothetical protein
MQNYILANILTCALPMPAGFHFEIDTIHCRVRWHECAPRLSPRKRQIKLKVNRCNTKPGRVDERLRVQ